LCRPDTYRLVGKFDVLRIGIRFRMHRDSLDAHFAARTLDAQRNFTTVGD
jgi:glycyl-tRNA synthetase (class II)